MYRKLYKDILKLTDEQIDRMPMLPTDRYFVGKFSEFVRNAPDDPYLFTRYIGAVRAFGCLWVLLVTGTIALALWAYSRGVLISR